MPPLSLGDSDFSNLRQKGKIYVDKTGLVYKLAKSDNKILLIRPRRFGKSLLVSTFYSLFKFGLRDFSNLEIERLWNDDGTYAVLYLDFSQVKNFDDSVDFEHKLSSYLLRYMKLNGFLNEIPTTPCNGIEIFTDWLATQSNNSVVLLVDEYDGPLTSCLSHLDTFQKVRKKLATFYSCIKRYSGIFRFVFLTGITKFGNAGIFSELNSFDDISLVQEFGDIAGYTLEEIKVYFGPYIKQSAITLNITEHELIHELVDNYNGFCFEETASKKVFAPWSVLNFFNRPTRGFRNYWFESGGQPSVLLEYVQEHALIDPAKYAEEKTIVATELSTAVSSNKLDEKALLVQTGYLTIKRSDQDGILYLGYPNREVAKSMALLCLGRLLGGKTLSQVDAGDILRLLATRDVDNFIKRINNAFLSLDFSRYFIKDEMSCEGAFLMVLQGSGVSAKLETHNALGKSDIEFSVEDSHWVIELKFARREEQISKKLLEGIEQVKGRHYGEQCQENNLMRLVMVFYEKERHFVKYAVLD
ncbi:MAG: ATP-binding protein [Burkholderiales bacterium]|nr:ATP-binding protein [Burkholderiales bacterium]